MSTESKGSFVQTAPWAFSKVVRSITVDVYLPKNLVNYGTLIDLLCQIVEFNGARQDLVRNVEKLLPIINEPASDFPDPTTLVLTSDPKVPMTDEELRSRLWEMKRRIEGYSIFEADGAFEHRKGNTIPVNRGKTFNHSPAARIHFEACKLTEWLGEAAIADPENRLIRGLIQRLQGKRSSASLEEDFSRSNPSRRILSYGTLGVAHQRHNFIVSHDDNSGKIRIRKCIRLLEERTLVIKFIADVKDDDKEQAVLWDVLVLIGCYFARKLGESGEGLEDEIWISYDLSNLWKWRGGLPASDEVDISQSGTAREDDTCIE